MGSKCSSTGASREILGSLSKLNENFGSTLHSDSLGQGDNDVNWDEMLLKLKLLPLQELCPHCNQIVKTSAEVLTEMRYFMMEAEKQIKKNLRSQTDDGKSKINYFAGIRKFSRAISKLEGRNDRTEHFVHQQLPEFKGKYIEDNEEGVYDEISNLIEPDQPYSLNLSSWSLVNGDEYETPRSLELSDELWRY